MMPLTKTSPLFLTMHNLSLEMVLLTYTDLSHQAFSNSLQRHDKTIINNMQPFLNVKYTTITVIKDLLTPWWDEISPVFAYTGEGEKEGSPPPQEMTLPPPCYAKMTLGHRWHISNITTIGNWQNTLILLTSPPLSGFSLYKYTIETHIKTLNLGQNHAYMADQMTHKSDSIKLLMFLVYFQYCLQKKRINNLFLLYHHNKKVTEPHKSQIILKQVTLTLLG